MKNYIKIAAIVLMSVALAGCGVNPTKAKRAAEAQGLKQFEITGYSWFGCGQDDVFKSNFTAIGANDVPVTGSVCSSWFKGITIRYD